MQMFYVNTRPSTFRLHIVKTNCSSQSSSSQMKFSKIKFIQL